MKDVLEIVQPTVIAEPSPCSLLEVVEKGQLGKMCSVHETAVLYRMRTKEEGELGPEAMAIWTRMFCGIGPAQHPGEGQIMLAELDRDALTQGRFQPCREQFVILGTDFRRGRLNGPIRSFSMRQKFSVPVCSALVRTWDYGFFNLSEKGGPVSFRYLEVGSFKGYAFNTQDDPAMRLNILTTEMFRKLVTPS